MKSILTITNKKRTRLTIVIAGLLAPTWLVLGLSIAAIPLAWPQLAGAEMWITAFLRSLVILFVALPIALFTGLLPALVIHFCDFPGRKLLAFVQLLALSLPAFMTAAIYLELGGGGFFETGTALALGLGFAGAPWVFLLARVALARLPQPWVDAAATLGLTPRQRAWRVYVPFLLSPLAVALFLVGAETFSDYGAASTVGYGTFSTSLYGQWFASQNRHVGLVMALVPLLLGVFVLITLARFLRRFRFATPPELDVPHRLRVLNPRESAVAIGTCLLTATPGYFLPLACALTWSLQRFGRARLDTLYGDCFSSLITAISTAALATALCLLAARWARHGNQAGWTERALWLSGLNFLLPPIVLAVVLLQAGQIPILSETRLPIIFANCARFLPLMLIPVADRLSRLPSSLGEAARSLGLTESQTFWRVTVPGIKNSLAGGAILIFLMALTELGGTLLLQPFGYQAVTLKVFALFNAQEIRAASIWMICLSVIALYPVWAMMQLLDEERSQRA